MGGEGRGAVTLGVAGVGGGCSKPSLPALPVQQSDAKRTPFVAHGWPLLAPCSPPPLPPPLQALKDARLQEALLQLKGKL